MKGMTIIVKISKAEMEYLQSKGIRFGENGLVRTSGHRRRYFCTESKKCTVLLDEYRRNCVVK